MQEKTKTNKLAMLGSFALLVAVVLVVAWVIFKIWIGLILLPAAITAAIFAGILTVGGSVTCLVISNNKTRQIQIEQEHRQQVIPIYKRFIEFWSKVTSAERIGDVPPTEVELIKLFNKFTQDMLLWASDEVVKE